MSNVTNQTNPETNQNGGVAGQSPVTEDDQEYIEDMGQLLNMLIGKASDNMSKSDYSEVERFTRATALSNLASLNHFVKLQEENVNPDGVDGDIYATILENVSLQLDCIQGLMYANTMAYAQHHQYDSRKAGDSKAAS